MQMGCIMRPYFLAQAASEGTTGRFMRGRSPHVMFEDTTKFNIKFAYLKKNLYLCTLNV